MDQAWQRLGGKQGGSLKTEGAWAAFLVARGLTPSNQNCCPRALTPLDSLLTTLGVVISTWALSGEPRKFDEFSTT